jgi:hypothetical protein
VGKVANLIAKREGSRQQEGREPAKVCTQRRYGYCKETSYNARTFVVKIVDASNSDKSKKYFYRVQIVVSSSGVAAHALQLS